MVSTQDLRNKEVINIYNGTSIGFVDDITLDLERGTVEGIVIPQQSRGLFSMFSKVTEMVIPWHCVRRIGDEVVLVELPEGFAGMVENGYDSRYSGGFVSPAAGEIDDPEK